MKWIKNLLYGNNNIYTLFNIIFLSSGNSWSITITWLLNLINSIILFRIILYIIEWLLLIISKLEISIITDWGTNFKLLFAKNWGVTIIILLFRFLNSYLSNSLLLLLSNRIILLLLKHQYLISLYHLLNEHLCVIMSIGEWLLFSNMWI